MAEPKIEHFFAVLKHRDFSVGSLASQIDDLAEFLHYVDPVRADSVVEEIEKQSEDARMQLIKSLACSYPLSQHIVARILKRIKGADADFISEFTLSSKHFVFPFPFSPAIICIIVISSFGFVYVKLYCIHF